MLLVEEAAAEGGGARGAVLLGLECKVERWRPLQESRGGNPDAIAPRAL